MLHGDETAAQDDRNGVLDGRTIDDVAKEPLDEKSRQQNYLEIREFVEYIIRKTQHLQMLLETVGVGTDHPEALAPAGGGRRFWNEQIAADDGRHEAAQGAVQNNGMAVAIYRPQQSFVPHLEQVPDDAPHQAKYDPHVDQLAVDLYRPVVLLTTLFVEWFLGNVIYRPSIKYSVPVILRSCLVSM